ncbi:Ascorbate-specific phosphotransferase enzyme IIA component [Vibrio ruber DSM 16370]|uniref:Ascorbate-specific PTS system EIIA component n=1 Tax=Vibrio ruber (strain DSM 16370 / JCM 11486 / BCRC 17186 / CECT 7878 / LMG 23124 / VR1) TaxID=1123498 RepID=A0A1R4LC84_VIBR1|nr:PTS sugar transporter subunit IIA [Vibrio ruber]SJN54176.1 Ascorbate-specific phosphotransferase enzyme IIA component [Vibrio ruber DSM 16370]
MLKALLVEANAIQLQVDAKNWQEALDIAARPLLEHHFINPSYLHAIKTTTEETGPYYVFEDERFALPHARPEDGVNRLGFSLVTLKHPITIQSSPEVDLIIMLCALDGHSHIEQGLRPIFERLSDARIREQLKQATTKEEVLNLL